jgi:hypothetical protein
MSRWQNIHAIPGPAAGVGAAHPGAAPTVPYAGYLDALSTRIGPLFSTLAGIPGHVVQVQQELTRLSNSTLSSDDKKLVADECFKKIIDSAGRAGFDFPQQTFTVVNITKSLSIERTNGKVIYYKS